MKIQIPDSLKSSPDYAVLQAFSYDSQAQKIHPQRPQSLKR
ncbi:hypothetical protein [Helicobacter felis]|nr:hypothetical protein [Helicobacter felis]